MFSGSLRVDTPSVNEGTVVVPFEADGDLGRLVNGDVFRTEYDVDVSDVPPGILVIPALATLAPITWATGTKLYVADVDTTAQRSLMGLRETLAEFYPEVGFSGCLEAEETTSIPVPESGSHGSTLLFSGGVDSVASYVRHRQEDPLLTVVRGADISLDNDTGWRRVHDDVREFARGRGVAIETITSNFREVVEEPLLKSYFGDALGGGWWKQVQHGPGIVGLCSPLAYAVGSPRCRMAASRSGELLERPWGSHPQLEGAFEWSGTEVIHDDADATRQEKVERIGAYIRETSDDLVIRSCYRSDDGDNCGRCEKCCRTAIGFDLAGVSPFSVGFPGHGEYEKWVRENLYDEWSLTDGVRSMWSELVECAETIETSNHDFASLYPWLREVDTEDLRTAHDGFDIVNDVGVPLLKYLPATVYRTVVDTRERRK